MLHASKVEFKLNIRMNDTGESMQPTKVTPYTVIILATVVVLLIASLSIVLMSKRQSAGIGGGSNGTVVVYGNGSDSAAASSTQLTSRTASTTQVIAVGNADTVVIKMRATASSTPTGVATTTLSLSIETSDDLSTWIPLDCLAEKSEVKTTGSATTTITHPFTSNGANCYEKFIINDLLSATFMGAFRENAYPPYMRFGWLSSATNTMLTTSYTLK